MGLSSGLVKYKELFEDHPQYLLTPDLPGKQSDLVSDGAALQMMFGVSGRGALRVFVVADRDLRGHLVIAELYT